MFSEAFFLPQLVFSSWYFVIGIVFFKDFLNFVFLVHGACTVEFLLIWFCFSWCYFRVIVFVIFGFSHQVLVFDVFLVVVFVLISGSVGVWFTTINTMRFWEWLWLPQRFKPR